MRHRRSSVFGVLAFGPWALAGAPVSAQQADTVPSSAAPAPVTLEAVDALPPDEEPPLDLYRFRNPVSVEPNRFDKAWQPPPTVEEISHAGGYIQVGIGLGLLKAGQALHTATGGRAQIQSATARPPPLDEAQMRRAQELASSAAEAGE